MDACQISFHQLIRYLFIPLLLVAFWLRVNHLFDTSLHADEALFATWSRQIYTLRDLFLIDEPADKPPLLFYTQAILYNFLPAEKPFTGRLPNLIASMALIPLTAIWAKRLYNHSSYTHYLLLIMVSFSPLIVDYSATGFTDPLMITLSVAAAATSRHRPTYSGILFGLAIATKYQALLWLPLILLSYYAQKDDQHQTVSSIRSWLTGFIPILSILTLWLYISFSQTEFHHTGDARLLTDIRPIQSWELIPRFIAWKLYIPLPIILIWGTIRKQATDRYLALFLLLYCTLLWLFSLPIYPRYILHLMPVLLIGISRLFIHPFLLIMPFCLTYLTFPSPSTFDFPLPTFPESAVLYDHYYSWPLRYYLYDSYTYVAWIPHPDALLVDLAVHYDEASPRYLILPNKHSTPFINPLNTAGYTLQTKQTTDTITLYQIAK